MLYAQPRIPPEKWDALSSLEFWDSDRSSNLGQTTRPSNSQQKKRELGQIVNFTVLAD